MTYYTLAELAKKTNCKLVGDPEKKIYGVADLESAGPDEASFLGNERYLSAMQKSQAGVIVISEDIQRSDGKNYLISDNPSNTFQELLEHFLSHVPPKSYFTGIHPTAVVHPTAAIEEGAELGPYVVVDGGAKVGKRSFIGAGCYIGPDAEIGEECTLYAHVCIREGVKLGNRVIVQPGAIIGSCGYGYTQDSAGRHIKLSQVGTVVVEDDVEIGANTTIDRARFKATHIGQGTKIDNLVQIAHNVSIGKHSLLIAQTGIAGSTQIGNHVILAGKVAVNGHIKIVDGVVVAACSGVSKSLLKPGRYAGVPVMELAEHNKNQVYLRNIAQFVQGLRQVQETLAAVNKSK